LADGSAAGVVIEGEELPDAEAPAAAAFAAFPVEVGSGGTFALSTT